MRLYLLALCFTLISFAAAKDDYTYSLQTSQMDEDTERFTSTTIRRALAAFPDGDLQTARRIQNAFEEEFGGVWVVVMSESTIHLSTVTKDGTLAVVKIEYTFSSLTIVIFKSCD